MRKRNLKFIIILVAVMLFSGSSTCLAMGKIIDYFLKNPEAWDVTKKIIQETPKKIIVTGGLKGLGFDLAELTGGDEVALIFLDSRKAVTFTAGGFCNAEDKLFPGDNRIVSVITRNYGDRTRFHYKFIFQRNKENGYNTMVYNNTKPILESEYDARRPVVDLANLSGISLCVIEIR